LVRPGTSDEPGPLHYGAHGTVLGTALPPPCYMHRSGQPSAPLTDVSQPLCKRVITR